MLRIEIYQQNACYRIPEIGNPILTFPLVPPSTIFGLLRYITSYSSINKYNTKIAISGIYESKIRHIITNHITGISDKGKYKSNIIPTEELFNVKHIIHIESNFENKINECIDKATRLGRMEDLINKIEIITSSEKKSNSCDLSEIKNLNYYIYVPFDKFESMNSLAIFNVPLDSDKDLLDKGFLKTYRVKLLFLRVQRLLLNQINQTKSDYCIDKDGYCYVWIN
ncbi:CRISPR-associated protein Cas5 [Calditerrivibrio nitroreducens]|uniref:CRISPR-associated protein Cas5 n=1 Tax=Calditerrivibrio nitroreducens (strain DSM 19672 / NBRC 101217 / Yu37-1) TaxID=768670 RepID=E4TH21_CALNY|nr:CRISPR-associated protein Cas5 [Calditerrivibrio nitroreducens]ADR19819.1 CRISPR-associated protein Cas5 [Calditerrivibrio nitroreducens DSM 19672]